MIVYTTLGSLKILIDATWICICGMQLYFESYVYILFPKNGKNSMCQ